MGNGGQNGGTGGGGLAQIEHVQGVFEINRGGPGIDHGRRILCHRSIQGGEQRAFKGKARFRQSGIVKFQNFRAAFPFIAHLLGAALAETDSMAETPRRELEPAHGIGHGQGFVLHGIDGQGADALHLRKVVKRQ